MTSIGLRRGQLRAALLALLPHAGKASENTPDYGRVRFYPRGEDLLAWTTDGRTSAMVRMTIDEHFDADLEGWDMGVAEIRAVLAVLKRPSNPDEQSVWDDAECTVDLLNRKVRFSESGDLFGGRDVTVGRLEPPGGQKDTYPDVPRMLHQVLAGTRPDAPRAGVRMDLLGRFTASAKPYEGSLSIRVSAEPPALLVRIGSIFVGEVSTRIAWEKDDQADVYETSWDDTVTPLMRPAVPDVPDDLVDELREQASEMLARGATPAEILKHGVGVLHAVPALADGDEDGEQA
jgi:hypothetical protein